MILLLTSQKFCAHPQSTLLSASSLLLSVRLYAYGYARFSQWCGSILTQIWLCHSQLSSLPPPFSSLSAYTRTYMLIFPNGVVQYLNKFGSATVNTALCLLPSPLCPPIRVRICSF